jgi:hypothetical protein
VRVRVKTVPLVLLLVLVALAAAERKRQRLAALFCFRRLRARSSETLKSMSLSFSASLCGGVFQVRIKGRSVALLPHRSHFSVCFPIPARATQFPRRLRLRVSRSARASHCARLVDQLRRPRAVSAAAAAEVRVKAEREKTLHSSRISKNCVLFLESVR